MERRLTEERITKTLINWLENNGWEIICYDFPQSGTGYCLHLNSVLRVSKNKGSIIPDIVAYRKGVVVIFENKDRFILKDLIKVNNLRIKSDYSESLQRLLKTYKIIQIYYGVGLPLQRSLIMRLNKYNSLIDFAILVDISEDIVIRYESTPIFHSA